MAAAMAIASTSGLCPSSVLASRAEPASSLSQSVFLPAVAPLAGVRGLALQLKPSRGRRSAHSVAQATATVVEVRPAEHEWKVKRSKLARQGVRGVAPKEAARLVSESGYVIVDVRPESEFAEAYPEGAINIQMYRLIKEWSARDILRRTAFAFFGVFNGTEENPTFLEEAAAQLKKDQPIIVACSQGGTTRPSQNFPDGKQSRSLIAAYLLALEGYTNIAYIEGGISRYFSERLPSVVKDSEN